MNSVVACSKAPLDHQRVGRLFCSGLTGLVLTLVLGGTAVANAGGKGVYLKVNYDQDDIDDALNAADTNVKGIVICACWAEIETSHGTFNWDALAAALDAATDSGGKSVILQIDLIGGGKGGVSSSQVTTHPSLRTPHWVLESPYLIDSGQYVGGFPFATDITEFPKYMPKLPWIGDAEYQGLVGEFLEELRRFLTGDYPYNGEPIKIYTPVIEFIFVTGWQAGSDYPNFYQDYVSVDTSSDLEAQFSAIGMPIDFDDLAVFPDSPYETAIADLADVWATAFSGTAIKFGVRVNPTVYTCTETSGIVAAADAHDWTIVTPNPNVTLTGLSYREMNRAYLGDLKSTTGSKVGVEGLSEFGASHPTTVSGWVDAIRACIGFDPPGGTFGYTGCSVPTYAYDAAAPASNATYILVDYATEYWSNSFACITKYANQLCKN